ncbi:MAG: hypothetical protein AcusKO_12910 [Acuticoccus sp.]
MTSREGRALGRWALAATLVLAMSGATTGAGQASRTANGDSDTTRKSAAATSLSSSESRDGNTLLPLRGEQTFDRGVWCTYKKIKVYDKFHDETFFIDKKVCLGTIVQ